MRPETALARFADTVPAGTTLRPLADGLVNRTWAVGAPPRYALQEVAPEFGEEVNRHIDAVTRALAAAGLLAPRLVRSAEGRLSVPGEGGRHWRLLTWIDGVNFHAVPSAGHAAGAAGLIARFHDALLSTPAGESLPVSNFHDTSRRMARLEAALDRTDGLERAVTAAFAPLAEAVLREWAGWRAATPPPPPPRPAHGDLKISNVLFTPSGVALALIDFDTLGRHGLDSELGDALRSWCNPAGEDTIHPAFDMGIFEASIDGYFAAARTATHEERESLVGGLGRMALELAARFLTDVVEDRYFAWDPAVAPGRRAHNLVRGEGQLALARLVAARRTALEAVVAQSTSFSYGTI